MSGSVIAELRILSRKPLIFRIRNNGFHTICTDVKKTFCLYCSFLRCWPYRFPFSSKPWFQKDRTQGSEDLAASLTWKHSKRWSSCSAEKSQASFANRSWMFFTIACSNQLINPLFPSCGLCLNNIPVKCFCDMFLLFKIIHWKLLPEPSVFRIRIRTRIRSERHHLAGSGSGPASRAYTSGSGSGSVSITLPHIEKN